jgi:hypothetical protein
MQVSTKHAHESEVFSNFSGGVNRSVPPFLIGQNDLYDATNFYYDTTTGYLMTRPGLKKYSTAALPGKVIGIYPFVKAGVMTVIAACDDRRLYYLDGNKAPQVIGAVQLSGIGRPSFATMAAKLAVASGGVGQTWDGNLAGGLVNNNSAVYQTFLSSFGKKDGPRILAVGDQTNLDRLTLSASKDPTDFDITLLNENNAKYVDSGYLDGSIATAVAVFRGDIFVFKRTPNGEARNVYILRNMADASAYWSSQPLSGDYGPINPFFLKELFKSLYFVDIEGPKRIDAVLNAADVLYDPNEAGAKIAGNMRPFIAADGFSIYDKAFGLWMIKPTLNSESFYCMDIGQDRWTWIQFAVNITAGEYCGGQMLFGDDQGWIYQYDTASWLDDGKVYPMTAETKWFKNNIKFREMAKEKYLAIVGIQAGQLLFGPKVQGVVKYEKPYNFGATWWDWPTVNALTPEQWNESLTKTVFSLVIDHNVSSGDYLSFYISVQNGLCALASVSANTAIVGKP